MLASGICSAISPPPITAATIKPRTRMAGISWVSRAPMDCAVKATVPMRRNANSQNMQSKSTDAIATPPSRVAPPSRPIAVVETMPISGVVRLATIAGPAIANTCAVVTLDGGLGEEACTDQTMSLPPLGLARPRRAEQPRQQPDRDHDHGAKQEVTPQPVHGVEAEIVDPLE